MKKLLLVLAAAFAPHAFSQSYPAKPVHIIVPSVPGSMGLALSSLKNGRSSVRGVSSNSPSGCSSVIA